MSNAREKIASIVYEGIKWGNDNAETSPAPDWVPKGNAFAQDEARKQADAIIAALPEMVLPLEWRQWGGGDGEITEGRVLGFEYSTARSVERKGLWRLRGPWPKHTYHPTKEAAKAAAQAHYTAQIMAAFGIDTGAMKEGKDA